MNTELAALFQADQKERAPHPAYGTPAYRALRAQDRARRERVAQLLAVGELHVAEDFYHAALIFQHGDELDDIWQAYTLARQAAEAEHRPARWLAAAAYDRWLMYQGRPQKYGTQIVPDGRRQRLWDIDPTTTDAERAAWDVPSLEEMTARARQITRTEPMPPMDEAPAWLLAAIERWREEETGR